MTSLRVGPMHIYVSVLFSQMLILRVHCHTYVHKHYNFYKSAIEIHLYNSIFN